MRFFIALEIPKQNLAQFRDIQASLHTLIPQLRITDLDKIHLTLAFIGEQPDTLIDNLTNVMQSAAKGISPFGVTPAYIDGFPDIHHPKVLWVGVKGDIDKILMIRERIKDRLEELKLPVEVRRFTPHITVAKSNSDLNISKALEVELEKMMAVSFNPIRISSIKLFESSPNEGFHKHNTLAEIRLTP